MALKKMMYIPCGATKASIALAMAVEGAYFPAGN